MSPPELEIEVVRSPLNYPFFRSGVGSRAYAWQAEDTYVPFGTILIQLSIQ